MHAALPHSALRIVEGAAHLPNLERPDEFNRVLAEFLANTGTRPPGTGTRPT